MTEREIYDGVVVNGTVDFFFVTETLRQHGTVWCVIDNFAVNAYTHLFTQPTLIWSWHPLIWLRS